MEQMKQTREPPLTGYLLNKASRQHIPVTGTFELSPVCNFDCRMCYVHRTQQEVEQHSRPMMKPEQWLELARQAREEGLLYLLLTGGEPLLYPRFWELYEQLYRMGFLLSINTNGSMITPAVIERLRRMPPIRINITLYGASNSTYQALCGASGAFDRVDRAIMGLKQAGIQVKLNCSLTPYNVQDLEAMVRYAKERELILDITAYMFPPLRRSPDMVGTNDRFTPEEAALHTVRAYRLQHSPEEYRQYLEQLCRGIRPAPGLDESCVDPADGRVRCRAGKAAFWITWDGYMTPCGMMPEPKTDLYGVDFSQAWRETTEKAAALSLSGLCRSCENRNICHACAAMALTETGTHAGVPRYLCRMIMAMKQTAEEALKNQIFAVTP